MTGSPVAPELWQKAVRAWLEGLPDDVQGLVAREARVHVARRDRSRLPALLLERYQENPFARAVLERWLVKSHEIVLAQVQAQSPPDEPAAVAFLHRLRQENHLDVPTVAWLVHAAPNPALAAAGPVAFPDEWPAAAPAPAPAPADATVPPEPRGGAPVRQLQKQMREREEEIRRLQATVARQEREMAALAYRLEQAQRKVMDEAARRQDLLAEQERARQAALEYEHQCQAQLQDALAALQKERQLLQAEAQAAMRLVRDREESLQEAARRLRRTRLEAERYRMQFLTLETYMDVTSPRRGALPPEAFMAYGELLDRAEAELLQKFRPDSARELAQRFAELQLARQVHKGLAQAALPLADDAPPTEPREAAGPLVRELEGGRERFYVRLPARYQPVDITAVAAIGAFPGDMVAVEPRLEQQPGGAHCYLFFHLRETRPRTEEIATLLPGGPPWLADTSRGPVLVMGAGDRRLEPGQPVVVSYPRDNTDCGCLLLRVLPYAGATARPLPAPARKPEGARPEEPAEDLAAPHRRPPLLEGRTIYILGGEGFESNYRQVVEGYGAQLLWTSGFSELRQIAHRVRQADAVVLVTRGVSHKAYDHLQSALTITGRPLFYCNALGQSQLERVLENEVIPTLAPRAAQR